MASYLIATNYHEMRLSPNWEASATRHHEKHFPVNVVLGFRAIFWKAFTRVYHQDAEASLTLAGRLWRLKSLVVLENSQTKERLGFPDPIDGKVIIVVALIETEDTDPPVDLSAEARAVGWNEQDFVNNVIKELADDPDLHWMSSLRHLREFPGRFVLKHKPEYGERTETLAMFGFHYFGLLLFWQIARDQVLIDLEQDPHSLDINGANLLTLRQRLINLDRFFLSTSISNDPGLKLLSRDCKAKQNMKGRFPRLPEINERIEKYFEIASQLATQREQRRLNGIVLLIAIMGLPISLMSMMLAMSTDAQVLKVPDKLFFASNVQMFLFFSALGSVIVLWTVAAIITARWTNKLLISAARLVRRGRQ